MSFRSIAGACRHLMVWGCAGSVRGRLGLLASVCLGSAIVTSGCTPLYKVLRGDPNGIVGAAPLAITNTQLEQAGELSSDAAKREFLGRVVLESETKCTDFLNHLVFAENSVNTTGDILTTAMSAVATVFTPISTVHGLTAAATITSGSKAAIDSDIYAKASIMNFQTALEQSYFKNIAAYTDALPDMTNIVVSVEVAKIESIHATCNLAAAESAIATTLSKPGGVPPKPTGLVATPYNGDVELSWSAVPNASTYSVYQGTAAGNEAVAPVATGVTSPAYSAKALVNGTQYFYRVVAENASGLSPLSDEVTATPLATLVNPPSPRKPGTHAAIPGQLH